MKYFLPILLCVSWVAWADTPPPGTVKAKMFTGDGLTALTATAGALDVNVTNSSGGGTVDQGIAGTDPWFVSVRNNAPLPVNACQETGGHLASIDSKLSSPMPVTGTFWQATQPVSIATMPTTPVTGTFWQATQPVSLASAPLPSGAATESTLLVVSSNASSTATSTASIDSKTPSLGQALSVASVPVVLPATQISTLTPLSTITANAGTGTFTVDGSGHTQPVSASALPLPSGASTAAKQPALGTAGTPSTDVLTVQGRSGMTALLVDGSGATQPITGTVTANAGTGTFTVDGSGHTQPVSGTFWQATQPVSGTFWQATQPVSGPLTDTQLRAVAVPVSGTFWQATQPVSGTVTANAGTGTFTVDGSGHTQPVSGTFWQATQPVSLATAPALVAGSAIIGKIGIDQTTPGTTNGVQVNAALPAGSNVIGHVIVDSAPTTAVSQSGTWTVQPGNTANTVPWLVTSTPAVPAALTVKQAAISVGTSAVRLTTDGSAPSATRVLLVAQLLSSSTASCFFGSSGVTSSSTGRGVQMFAGSIFSFTNDAGDYYAICDNAAQTVLVTEQE